MATRSKLHSPEKTGIARSTLFRGGQGSPRKIRLCQSETVLPELGKISSFHTKRKARSRSKSPLRLPFRSTEPVANAVSGVQRAELFVPASSERLLQSLKELHRLSMMDQLGSMEDNGRRRRIPRRVRAQNPMKIVSRSSDSLGPDGLVLCGGTVPPSFGSEGSVSMAMANSSIISNDFPVGPEKYWTDLLSAIRLPQKGEIFLPATTSANDVTRVMNAGHALPNLAEGATPDFKCPRNAHECSTPRRMRGLVREADALSMKYPEHVDPPTPRQSSLEPSLREIVAVPSHVVRPDVVTYSWKPNFGADVSWKPDESAKKKTTALLDSLYTLRRVGKQNAEKPPDANPSVPEKEPQKQKGEKQTGEIGDAQNENQENIETGEVHYDDSRDGEEAQSHELQEEEAVHMNIGLARNPEGFNDFPLLQATLCNVDDTVQSLQKTAQEIKEVYGCSQEYGGSRHPTSVFAMKTLAVIERKMQLAGLVEERLSQVEKAYSNRNSIINSIVEGTSEPPAEIMNLNPFMKSITHPGGNPMDADKSNFDLFVKTFGLHAKHHAAAKLAHLLAAFAEYWGVITLEKANAGVEVDAVMRLLAVAKNLSGGKKSPTIDASNEVICNAMAEKVLDVAIEMKKKDGLTVAKNDTPQVESAQKCANDINAQIKSAVDFGCEPKHPCLSEAKGIATELQMASKDRIAQKALLYAKLQKLNDEKVEQTLKEGEIVEVGQATRFADAIEDAVKRAIQEGAPKVHEFLQEAQAISSQLRQKDGERKRLKARQNRAAAKEQK